MSDSRLPEAARELRRYDHDRYLLALFAEGTQREELFALYAFNQEIAKTAEVVSEPIIGRIRLQWWRESLEGLFSGQPRRHYILGALAAAAQGGRLPKKELERLIDAREQDLDRTQPQDLEEFEDYCEETGATLLRATLELLDVAPEDRDVIAQAARHIGIAYATTGLLRAVPFHAMHKHILLPRDHVAVAGVNVGDLYELKPQEALSGVVMRLAKRAGEHLDGARKLVPTSKSATPLFLHGSLASLYLKRIEQAHFDPFNPRVAFAPPSRMPRLAWLAWRGRW